MAPKLQKALTIDAIEEKLDSGRLNRKELLRYLESLPKSPEALDHSERIFDVIARSSRQVLNIGDFEPLSKTCVETALGVCATCSERKLIITDSVQSIAGAWIAKAHGFGELGKSFAALSDLGKATMPKIPKP
jgi:hypothetical protein